MITKNRIICVILLLGVFVVFMWGIPIGIYNRYEFILSVGGGLLCFVLIGQALGEFSSVYELLMKEEADVTRGRQLAPFAVVPGFFVIFVFLMHNSSRAEHVLKAEGVVTKGNVEDGRTTTSTRKLRTSTTYKLEYSYKDGNQITYRASESVSSSEFSEAYQGMPVDVVYWKKDPSVSKLVVATHDLVKYKKVPNNKVTYKEIIRILEHKVKEDSVLEYLNSLNYEWLEGEGFYANEKLGLALKVINNNQVAYIEEMTHGNPLDFCKELEKDGFTKVTKEDSNKNLVAYTKWPYTVVHEIKVSNGFGQNASPKNIYYFIRN